MCVVLLVLVLLKLMAQMALFVRLEYIECVVFVVQCILQMMHR